MTTPSIRALADVPRLMSPLSHTDPRLGEREEAVADLSYGTLTKLDLEQGQVELVCPHMLVWGNH